MAYWLVKSEEHIYSIGDLKRDRVTSWDCIRNYQARNYLREFAVGDRVLFYHSSSEPTGIGGLAKVARKAQPDQTQFDPKSEYFDPKATKAAPRWFSPELQFEKLFTEFITLAELRKVAALKKMVLLQRGSRLSVQPVTAAEFSAILKLADA